MKAIFILFTVFILSINVSHTREKLNIVNIGQQSDIGCYPCLLFSDWIFTPVLDSLTGDTIKWKYMPLTFIQANSWYDRVIGGYDQNGNAYYAPLQAKIPYKTKINGVLNYVGTITATFEYKITNRCLYPTPDVYIPYSGRMDTLVGINYDIVVYIHTICFKSEIANLDEAYYPSVTEMLVHAQREIMQSTYYYFWPLFEKQEGTNQYKHYSGSVLDSCLNGSESATRFHRNWIHFYFPCAFSNTTITDNNDLAERCYTRCSDNCCTVSYLQHLGFFWNGNQRCFNHKTITGRMLASSSNCATYQPSANCPNICSEDLFAFASSCTIFNNWREIDPNCAYCSTQELLLKPITVDMTENINYDNIKIYDVLGNLVNTVNSNNVSDYNAVVQNMHGLFFVGYYAGSLFIKSKSIYFE